MPEKVVRNELEVEHVSAIALHQELEKLSEVARVWSVPGLLETLLLLVTSAAYNYSRLFQDFLIYRENLLSLIK